MLKVIQICWLMIWQVQSSSYYIWKPFSSQHEVEKEGVNVGQSMNRSVYIGGASFGGQAAPGSVIFPDGLHYPYGGAIHVLPQFDYLVNDENFEWANQTAKQVPVNAVVYGFMAVPVGRAFHDGEWKAGKVCGPRCIYIASDNKEVKLSSFQVLIYDP